jgi:hypothetical protein
VSGFGQTVPVPLAFQGGARHLRLEVVGGATGTTISLYIDGALLASVLDASALTSGTAGIRGMIRSSDTTGPTFDNFQVRAFDPLSVDDFGRGASPPDSSLNPVWVPQSGSFTIVSNQAQGGTPTVGTYNIATEGEAAPVNVSASVTTQVLNSGVSRRAGLVARYQEPGDYYAAALVYEGGHYYGRIYRYLDGVETQLKSSDILPSTLTSTTVVTLRFEVLGSSLALYLTWGTVVDSRTVTVNDDQISGPGGVGLYSSSTDPIDNFVAQFIGGPAASHPTRTAIRFRDGFELPDNTSLAAIPGWQIVTGGDVTIKDGQAKIPVNASLSIALVTSPASLGDVAVEADVPVVADTRVGLVARYTTAGYYRALLYFYPSGLTYSAKIDWINADTSLVQVSPSIVISTSTLTNHHVNFELLGDILTLYVDGAEIRSGKDDTFTGLGQVGLWGDQGATFDNFLVRSIDQVAADAFGPSGNLAPTWTAQNGGFMQVDGHAQGTQSLQNVATMNGPRLADVSVSATLTVANVAGHLTGVILRYQDANDYLTAVIFDSGGAVYVKIVQYVNGNATTPLPPVLLSGVNVGDAVDIRFEALGDQLLLWVNGVLKAPQNAPVTTTLLGPGLVGMLAYNDSTVDDFSADAL